MNASTGLSAKKDAEEKKTTFFVCIAVLQYSIASKEQANKQRSKKAWQDG